jgi:hypothetical protein
MEEFEEEKQRLRRQLAAKDAREQQLEAETGQLEAQLTEEADQHKTETYQLKEETGQLKAQLTEEADQRKTETGQLKAQLKEETDQLKAENRQLLVELTDLRQGGAATARDCFVTATQ